MTVLLLHGGQRRIFFMLRQENSPKKDTPSPA